MAEEIGFRIKVQGASEQLKAMTALKAELNSLAVTKQKLNKESKSLTAQFESGKLSIDQYDDSMEVLSAQQVKNSLLTQEATAAYKKNDSVLKANIKSTDSASGSYNSLAAQYKLSKLELNGMSKAQRKGTVDGQALEKRSKALHDEMNELQKATGNSALQVGNYGEAMSAATPLLGEFGGKINQVQQTLVQIKGLFAKVTGATKANAVATQANAAAQTALGAATKGTAGSFNIASKAAKIFKFALAATGIGAIVVILGTLITAILSTQRGADAMTRVMAPLKEVLATIFGLIQKVGLKVFDKLKDAINDPGQALKDLGNAFKKNIINRFTAAVNLVKLQGRAMVVSFKALGLGIKKALAGVPLLGKGIDIDQVNKDLAEVKAETIQIAKELKDNLIQVGTGLDPTQIQAIADAGKEFADQMSIAAERGSRIAELTIEIEEADTGLNRAKEKGNRLFEEQKKIAEDVLLTDGQRIKAAQEAQRILKETEKIQIDQLDRQIKLAKIKTEANDTSLADKKEIEELEAKKEALVATGIGKSIELRNKENAIIKTRIDTVRKAQEAETKRLEKLEDERTKIAEKDTARALQTELEILDIKAQALQTARELEIASTDETDQVRLDKEIELQKKLTGLKIEGAEAQAGALEIKEGDLIKKLAELKKESGGKETLEILKTQDALNQAKAARETILNKDIALIKEEDRTTEAIKKADFKKAEEETEAEAELERLQAKEELKKAIVDASFAAGEIVADGISKRAKARIDEEKNREISALEAKKQAGIISQAEFESARLAIDKKAFDKQKKADTARAIINGVVAAGKTFATLGFTPPALVAVGLGAIKTTAEIATIQSQKFAKGGVLKGASHDGGGVQLGNNQEGEGGEAIINKKSTAKHIRLLSAINEDGGGVALDGASEQKRRKSLRNANKMARNSEMNVSGIYFEKGGLLGDSSPPRLKSPTTNVSRGFIGGGFTSEPQSIDLKAFEDSVSRSVIASIESIPVVNDPTATASENRGVENIQNEVNF
tara:strand:+ start:1868 stop:4924 length:3057 start_codon:yes stop_codon:yes gene_type:complete